MGVYNITMHHYILLFQTEVDWKENKYLKYRLYRDRYLQLYRYKYLYLHEARDTTTLQPSFHCWLILKWDNRHTLLCSPGKAAGDHRPLYSTWATGNNSAPRQSIQYSAKPTVLTTLPAHTGIYPRTP